MSKILLIKPYVANRHPDMRVYRTENTDTAPKGLPEPHPPPSFHLPAKNWEDTLYVLPIFPACGTAFNQNSALFAAWQPLASAWRVRCKIRPFMGQRWKHLDCSIVLVDLMISNPKLGSHHAHFFHLKATPALGGATLFISSPEIGRKPCFDSQYVELFGTDFSQSSCKIGPLGTGQRRKHLDCSIVLMHLMISNPNFGSHHPTLPILFNLGVTPAFGGTTLFISSPEIGRKTSFDSQYVELFGTDFSQSSCKIGSLGKGQRWKHLDCSIVLMHLMISNPNFGSHHPTSPIFSI